MRHLPTINDAFRNQTNINMLGCTILIKFDFNKQLYYMDVSFFFNYTEYKCIKMDAFYGLMQ